LSEPLKKNPLTLNAHATLADDAVNVDRVTLRSGDSAIDASALIALSGKQQFNAKGTVRSFRLRDFANVSQGSATPLPDGLINGEFSVSGTRQPALEADATFRIDNSHIANNPLSGEGQVQLRANSLLVPKLTLRVGSNNLTAQGKLAERDSRITFALNAPALEQLGTGFGGAMQIDGEVRGSVQQPRIVASWNGSHLRAPGNTQIDSTQGKADVLLNRNSALLIASAVVDAAANGVRIDTQQLASLNAQINMAAQPNAPLSIVVRAGGIDGSQLRAQNFALDVSGTTAQHALTATLAEREQNWQLTAAGGVQNLQRAPSWQGMINTLDAVGRFNAKLAAPAALQVSSTLVQLDRFQLNADNALIAIDQFVRNGDSMSTRGKFEHLQVGKLLPYFQSQPSIDADLQLGGEWNLKLDNNLNGTFAVRRESGDVVMLGNAPVALGLSSLNASANASNGRIALKFLAEGKQLGRIDVGLDTTLGGGNTRFSIAPSAPLNGSAQINTPALGWLGPLVSQTLVTEGSLQGNVALTGTFGNPHFDGQLAADKLRLLFTDTGVDLKQGTLRSEFQGNRLIVKTLNFQNDGTLDISGPISLVGQQLALELAIKATRYKLIDRSDRKIVASGESVVGWRNNGLKANGKFTIDSGMVDIGTADTPELSDDVVVLGQTVKQGTKTAIALDLEIDLGSGVHLSGRGLDAKLVGQLRLLANAGDALRAEGTLRVASGTFKAYGRELTIERGLLRFNGALNNPALDILAMRKGQEVEAGVQVGGNVLTPRVTLVSDPVVADAEKLSWLVLGRGLSTAGGSDVGALQTAASSLLAQGAAAGLSSQLATAFGLDDFSVGTSDTNLQERIVTLGKKISSRLYVSYQQGLQSASSVLLLRYTLTPRISIEAEAGTRSALSMFYNFAFD
jgi:translocation and assembly module TamB